MSSSFRSLLHRVVVGSECAGGSRRQARVRFTDSAATTGQLQQTPSRPPGAGCAGNHGALACPATRGRLAGAGRGARGRPVWLLVFGPPVQDSPAHSEGALPRGAWGRRVLTGAGLLPGRGQRPPPRLTLRCPVLPVTHPHVGERMLAPAGGSRRGAVSCFSHLFSSLVVIEQRRWAVTNSPACTRVCRHGRFVSPTCGNSCAWLLPGVLVVSS